MPGVKLSESNDSYSNFIGAIYVFNLIVGTGALTIPSAFSHAGWLLGVIAIILLAFISYVTTTYVIETMAAANAMIQWWKLQKGIVATTGNDSVDSGNDEVNNEEMSEDKSTENAEREYLLDSCDMSGGLAVTPTDFYSIQKQVEMGQMARMFFNKGGLILFYIIICIYLYGDLAIYGAAVSKTLRDITCTYVPVNESCNATLLDDTLCWKTAPINRINAYRLFLAIFLVVVGPFVFFNVQKTKALQILTSALRWLAFGIMIVLACIHLNKGKGRGNPAIFDFTGLPNLFGVCVYSFMCHHSLPSLITPISKKSTVYRMMAFNYFSILIFYLLVALTGVFSFETLRDLYTLNFEPDRCNPNNPNLPTNSAIIQYFLSLFPVFTLGTNFPIIGITLRNNLLELLNVVRRNNDSSVSGFVQRIGFPVLAILPPILVSFATEDLQFLVGITGSFAGVGVQYVIPTFLLICSERACRKALGTGIKNRYNSPFRHRIWTTLILFWSLACLVFIITNYVIKGIL